MRSWSISTQSDTPISCPASVATVSNVALFMSISCCVSFVGEYSDLAFQGAQRPVSDAERGQMLDGAIEILAVGSEQALRHRNPLRRLLLGELPFIARMRAIGDEGEHTRAPQF